MGASEAVQKELAKLRKLAGELLEQADRLDAVLNEQPTEGKIAHGLVTSFGDLWEHKYRAKYAVPNWAAATTNMKRLVKQMGAAEVALRMSRYLASSDGFYVQAKHPLPMFISAVNKFATRGSSLLDDDPMRTTQTTDDDLESAAPADCRHRPACRTDEEHTRKRARELRG